MNIYVFYIKSIYIDDIFAKSVTDRDHTPFSRGSRLPCSDRNRKTNWLLAQEKDLFNIFRFKIHNPNVYRKVGSHAKANQTVKTFRSQQISSIFTEFF